MGRKNKKYETQRLVKEIRRCKKCNLYKTIKNFVVGSGDLDTKIMFIAEAPGHWEDVKGEPFVGRAGKILDELLKSIKLKREKIFICNILKCRPPENRNPQKREIESCTPYLLEQIKIIKPKVICSLGNFSTAFIFRQYGLENKIKGVSRLHGKFFKSGKTMIIPFYHPAVVVYNNKMKKILIKDFLALKNLL